MNKTDQRQCIDELIALGKTKQFSSIFVKALKGGMILTNIEKILEDKRRAYNWAFTNVLKKYGIRPEDLYGDLDKIWNICLNEKNKGIQEKYVTALAVASATSAASAAASATGISFVASMISILGTDAFMFAIVTTPLAVVLSATLAAGAGGFYAVKVTRVVYRVHRIWKDYKNNSILYAKEYLSNIN